MLLAFAAIVAGLGACNKQKTSESGAPTATGEAAISGTITVDAALQDRVGKAPLLLIFASTSSDPSKPALVVKREADVTFPHDYKLTAEDITLTGSSFRGKLYVTARIDPAGMVGPARPGTFDGSYPGNPVNVGSSKVDIVIKNPH